MTRQSHSTAPKLIRASNYLQQPWFRIGVRHDGEIERIKSDGEIGSKRADLGSQGWMAIDGDFWKGNVLCVKSSLTHRNSRSLLS